MTIYVTFNFLLLSGSQTASLAHRSRDSESCQSIIKYQIRGCAAPAGAATVVIV